MNKILAILIFIVFFIYNSIYAYAEGEYQRKSVLTTSVPIGSLASMIAEDRINISIFRHSGGCIHHLHLKPEDIKLIESQDLILYSSDSFEPMMAKIHHKNKAALNSSDRMSHFWLDPFNLTKNVLKKISNEINKLGIQEFDITEKNLAKSLVKIDELEKKMNSIVDQNRHRNIIFIITSNDELESLLNHFNIRYIYKNLSNIRHSAEVINLMMQENYRIILTQHHLSDKIEKFIDKTKIVKLDTENWSFNSKNELQDLYFKEILNIIQKLYKA